MPRFIPDWSAALCVLLLLSVTVLPGAALAQAPSEYDLKLREQHLLVTDRHMVGYVERVLERLHKVRPAGAGRLSLSLVKSDVPNAFTTGNGFIYVYSGLLKVFQNEAELALILGHEIAHGDMRHIDQKKRGGQLLDLARNSTILFGKMLEVGFLGFGRLQERAADLRGLRYIIKAGYDPEYAAQSLHRLGALGKESLAGYWQRTHPLSAARYFYVSKLAQLANRRSKGGRIGAEDYQKFVLNRLR